MQVLRPIDVQRRKSTKGKNNFAILKALKMLYYIHRYYIYMYLEDAINIQNASIRNVYSETFEKFNF